MIYTKNLEKSELSKVMINLMGYYEVFNKFDNNYPADKFKEIILEINSLKELKESLIEYNELLYEKIFINNIEDTDSSYHEIQFSNNCEYIFEVGILIFLLERKYDSIIQHCVNSLIN